MPTASPDTPATPEPAVEATGLDHDEDVELRRLHGLIPYAAPDSQLMRRYDDLRARDRRRRVRDLTDDDVAQVIPPGQRAASPGEAG